MHARIERGMERCRNLRLTGHRTVEQVLDQRVYISVCG